MPPKANCSASLKQPYPVTVRFREATARAMAQGFRAQPGALVAGHYRHRRPGWRQRRSPAGTVCFAWAQRDGGCSANTSLFAGDRRAVRAQAVAYALQQLRQRLPD